ncbi:MAG: acetolactate synthase small subunit [Moraxella sp.]|nr:acetolactate synthase small subunit [Moraxella sp.]
MSELKKHLISVLMENEAGSLSRLVGLFSQRGYNIDSLNVAATEDPTLSRLTLTTITTDDRIEQITKQLHKLIEVVKVQNLSEVTHNSQIERELMLIKVRATGSHREEIYRIADIFRAQIVDVAANLYTILITGDAGKLDGFIDVVGRDKILEVVRSGVIGIARGERTLSV